MRIWLPPWQCLFLLALATAVWVDGAAVEKSPAFQIRRPAVEVGKYLENSDVDIFSADGSRVKVHITELVEKRAYPGEMTSEPAGPVEILDWQVKYLPRDYNRPEKPYGEALTGYLRLRNHSTMDLSGLVLQAVFTDSFGHFLHGQEIAWQIFVPAGGEGISQRFWFVENNEFVANDPFDIIRIPVENGTLRLNLQITEVQLSRPLREVRQSAEQ